MNWDLKFISREVLKTHVKKTIAEYGDIIKPMDLTRFNGSIIDPIKLTFDSKVYGKDIKITILDEITRQRDKSNNNTIGYFHQNLFAYIKDCVVPKKGWDIIWTRPDGSKFNVELKNKHNTMNSSSTKTSFLKMQDHILNNQNDMCALVEVIAKASQNIVWKPSVDGVQLGHSSIRRISIDKFYELVTGDALAFKKICDNLPIIIEEIMAEAPFGKIGKDTVIEELSKVDKDLLKALYLLAFKSYEGF